MTATTEAGPESVPKKIVVCDDDDTMTDLLEFLLTKEGYAVSVARDGAEAIQLLDTVKPNLLLLDLDMPLTDGFEVLSTMVHKDEFQQTGVIVISGKEREEDIQRALKLGGLAFFTKPFNAVELVQKVRLLLDREAPSV